MANGKIQRLIGDKGFGFIKDEGGQEYFFHRSELRDGTRFESLQEGQRVEFTPGQGPKGPRAEAVRPS